MTPTTIMYANTVALKKNAVAISITTYVRTHDCDKNYDERGTLCQ